MIAHALLLPIFAIDDRSTRHLRPVYRSYRRQRRPVPVGAAFDPTNAIVINPRRSHGADDGIQPQPAAERCLILRAHCSVLE
jgi:hypothetical protein